VYEDALRHDRGSETKCVGPESCLGREKIIHSEKEVGYSRLWKARSHALQGCKNLSHNVELGLGLGTGSLLRRLGAISSACMPKWEVPAAEGPEPWQAAVNVIADLSPSRRFISFSIIRSQHVASSKSTLLKSTRAK
jgi:hypothetical protein